MKKSQNTIETGILYRTATLEKAVDDSKRLVTASISSETPYERHWGIEILSHDPSHVNLDRVQRGAVPFLADHDTKKLIGKVMSVRLDGDRAVSTIKMGNSKLADEIYTDIKDEIRTEISIGYVINRMKLIEADDSVDAYKITDWELLHVASVAEPADPTVGIGRANKKINHQTVITNIRNIEMDKDKVVKNELSGVTKEKNRAADILAIGKMSDKMTEAVKAVADGTTVVKFRQWAFEQMVDKQAEPAVGMDSFNLTSRKNDKVFSLQRLIASQIPGSKVDAGYELEVSQETRRQFDGDYQGFAVPLGSMQQRDVLVGTDSAGGYTVATDLLTSSFAELLRAKSLVTQMGATVLTGLSGDQDIPTQATGSTAYFVGETDSVTESSPTFGKVSMAPTRVGTFVDVTKKAIYQSSLNLEQFLKSDMTATLATAVDTMAITGSGSNDEPTGILNTSGIGSVAGGTNGLAVGLSHLIALESDIADVNADFGSLGYLTNTKVRGALKQVFTNATYGEIPLWQNGSKEGFGQLNGYRAGASNNVPSNLTKGSSSGVCSAVLFGNWADLIIGYWGALDIIVDPYTLSTSGRVRITINLFFDVAVRRAASFSAMLDALTA
jgi:HK97 family phage major capsid protein